MADIDERVLKMTFDNQGFEQGVDRTIDSLSKLNSSLSNIGTDSGKNVFDSLQNSANSINFDALNQAIDTINYRFSDFGVAATRVIENLTDTVLDFSTTLAKSLTIEPITAGWGEYNQLIDIARLMKANTTSTMDEINAFTDRLNEYADKTKYNFLNMAEGAKQFVQATGSLEYTFKGTGESVDLEKLVEGATNYLAMTGGSNAQLSNVLEVFGRALQSGGFNGKLSYQRLVRNGAGGKLLEDVLREAARSMGREDMMNTAIEMAGSFAESFNKQVAKGYAGWANDDVIAEALRILSDPNTAIGRKAYQASTEATTFQELMDQSYEALQSGWTRIWRSIIGDLEEAKDVWYELNIILNGAEGILTRYADWFGNLAEGWRELGGRENLITGLLDALQGILNIVEAIKDTIADLFPGLDAYNLAEASEDFGLGASKFKKWTEDLRGYFGSFIGGYDIWKEVIEDEPIHHTETYGPDYEAYTAALDAAIFPYMSEIDNWIAELIQYDKEGNFDLKATKTAIQNKDFSTTRYSTGDKDLQKDLKSIQKLLTSYVEYVYGGNPTSLDTYSRKYYNYGAMASEYYDTLSEEAEYRQMDLAILRELGVNTIELENQIRDSLTTVEEWDEPQSHEERKHSARVVQGNDWFQQYIAALWDDSLYQEGAVDGVVEIYNTSQSLVKVVYALTSGLRYVWDTVKNIYDIMVKPLVSSVLTQAIHSIIEVVSRFAERFTKFINGLRSSYFFENIAYNITRIINQSANFQTFFDKVTAVLLKINTIFWDLIDNAGTLFSIITNNETLRTIGYYADYIWNYILGPLISNDVKAGAAAGGILGSLFGAIKGFFTGGPFGMIVGGIQGLISGATKGGVLGKITGVLDYLLNHASEFTNVLKRFKDRIAELWEAFAKGFKSVTIGENNPIRKFFEWIITALGNIKNAITSADPLGAINEFLNSETMDNIIETLKKPFESAGEFIGNIVEFISTNVGSFFNTIGTKWEAYMKQFNNNPLEAFFNMVKDSALVSAIRSLGETILECFNSFKEGLLGVEETGDGKLEEKLSLFTRFTNWFRNLEKELNLYKTNPFTKTSIKDILNGFKLIGYAIRQLYNVISSGDLFGIIIDGFSILGEVVGSLINGIRKVPDKIGELFSSGDAESKSFSERVHDIKESLDEFLQSDAITQLKEKFYSFGETVSGFFSDAIEFGKTTLGGFFEFITNNKVKDFFGEVKDTIEEFAKALIEGFTGVDLKDNVTGFFETLTEKLREFKESDAFDEILNKIKSIGQKISDLFAWFNGLFSSEKKEEGAALFGWLSGFSIPKIDTGKAEEAVSEAVQNITEAADEAIQNSEEGHKEESGIAYLFKSIIGGLFGANVSAATLPEDNIENVQGVVDGVNTLAEEVNKNDKEVTEAQEPTNNISNFLSALGETIKYLAVGGAGFAGVGAIVLIATVLKIFKGVVGVASVIAGVSGLMRAEIIWRYVKSLIAVVAAIAGLAVVITMLGPNAGSTLVDSILIVLGVLVVILLAMERFAGQSQSISQNLSNKPFELLAATIGSIADGIQDIFKKAALLLPIIGLVAGILAISFAIAKLAKIDLNALKTSAGIVMAIATVLITFMVGVFLMSSILKNDQIKNIASLSISIFAIGAGIYAIVQAFIDVLGIVKEFKEIDENALFTLGATIGTIALIMLALIGSIWLLSKALKNNQIDWKAMLSAAIGIIAVAASIVIITDSIIKLINTLNGKGKTLDKWDYAITFGGISLIILAMGKFVDLAASEKNNITLRSSIALLALAAALNIIIGPIEKIANLCIKAAKKLSKNGLDNNEVHPIIGAVAAISTLALALGGAIGLMGSGNGVTFRSVIALVGIITGTILLINAVQKVYNIITTGDGKAYAAAIISIIGIVLALAKAVDILKAVSTTTAQGTTTKESTGFAGAIAAIIMVGAVWLALLAIEDVATASEADRQKYITAFIGLAAILGSLTIAVSAIQLTSKNAKIRGIVTVIAVIASVAVAVWALEQYIKDTDKLRTITVSLGILLVALGAAVSLIMGFSKDIDKQKGFRNGNSKSSTKKTQTYAGVIAAIGIVVSIAAAIGLLEHYISDVDKFKTIATALGVLVGVVAIFASILTKVSKSTEIITNNGKDKNTNSTTYAGVFGAVALVSSVALALGLLANNIDDVEKFKTISWSLGILIGEVGLLSIFITELSKTSFISKQNTTSEVKTSMNGILTIVALVGGISAALWLLYDNIQDIEKFQEISSAMEILIGEIGLFTAIILAINTFGNKTSTVNGVLQSVTNEPSKLANTIETLVEIVAIVASAGITLTLMAQNIEETDKLMDIALAMTEFMGAIAVITYVISLIGPIANNVNAGLAAVGKVAGVIAIVITVVSSLWGMFQDWASDEEDNEIKKKIGTFVTDRVEDVGNLLKQLAGFIGDMVHEFKTHSSIVNDSQEFADGANDVTTAVNNLTDNISEVDPANIDKVKEVIEAFTGLESAMVEQTAGNHLTNAFELFGNDLNKFTDPFAHFVQTILEIQNSEGSQIDIEQLKSLCAAVEIVAGMKFEVKDGWFTNEVGIGEIGSNLSTFGAGLYEFYTYAMLMSNEDSINRAIQMANDIATAFSTDGDTKFRNIDDAKKMIEGIGTGVYNATTALAAADTSSLGVLTLIFKALADIASAAYVFGEDKLGIFDFLSNLDLSNLVKGIEESFQNVDTLQSTIDEFSSKLRGITSDKQDEFRSVGSAIGRLISGGLTTYFQSDSFLVSVGFVVWGLKNGITKKEEDIKEAGKFLGSKLKEGYDEETVTNSPSLEFFKRGVYAVKGLIEGITNSEPDAIEKMKELGRELGLAFSDAVEGEVTSGSLANSMMPSTLNNLFMLKNNSSNIEANKKASKIIANYGRYLENSALNDSDRNKLSTYKRYRDQLSDLYSSGTLIMPEEVENTIFKLENYIDAIETKLSNRFDSSDYIENTVDKIGEGVEEVQAETEGILEYLGNEILNVVESADPTNSDSLNGALDSLNNIMDTATDALGGVTGLFSNEEGLDFYELLGNAKGSILDSISNLTESTTGFIKKQGKTLLKELAPEEIYECLSTIGDAITSGDFGGSLLDGLKEFGISATTKDVEKYITGDLLKTLLSKVGFDNITPDIFTKLVNSSGDLNDLFNSLTANGYKGSLSELIDGMSYIQEFIGGLGVGSINSDFYGDISALLGFDPQATGKSAGGAIGEYLGEAIETGVEEAAVDSHITDMAWRVISGEFGNNPDRQRLLEELGMSFEVIQNEVNRLLGCNYRYATSSEDLQRTLAALGDTALEVEDAVINTSDALVDMGTGESLKQFSDEDIVRGAQSIDTIREKLGDLISEYFEFSKYADKNGLKRDASKDDLERDAKNLEELNNIKKAYYSEQWRAANDGREADTSALVEGLTKYIEEHGDDYTNVTSLIENLLSEIESGEALGIRDSMNQIIYALEFATDESKVEFNEMIQAAMRAVSDGDIEAARQIYLQALAEFEQAKGYAGLSDDVIIEYYDSMIEATKTVASAVEVANDDDFKGEPTITKVVDQPDPDYSGLPGVLPNGTGKVPLNFSDSVGFDNVNSIAGKFDRSLDDNTKVLASLENIYSELGLLKDAWYDAKVVLDTGVLVGELTPGINQQLQTNQSRRERGI